MTEDGMVGWDHRLNGHGFGPLQADAETGTRELAVYLGSGLKGPLRETECDGGGKKAIEGAPMNRYCLATGLSAQGPPKSQP